MKSSTLLACVGVLVLCLGATALPRADIEDDGVTNEQDAAALNKLLSTLQSTDESVDDEPDTFLQSVDETTDDEPDELMKIAKLAGETQLAQDQALGRFMSTISRMIRIVARVRNTKLRRKLAYRYICALNRILARNPALRRRLRGYEEAEEEAFPALAFAALPKILAGVKLGQMGKNFAKKYFRWAKAQDDTDDVDIPEEAEEEAFPALAFAALPKILAGVNLGKMGKNFAKKYFRWAEAQDTTDGIVDDDSSDKVAQEQIFTLIKHFGAQTQDDTDGDDDSPDDAAQAQIIGHLIRSFWAEKQDDTGSDDDSPDDAAQAQIIGHLIRSFWAEKQDDTDSDDDSPDDTAQAQIIGSLIRRKLTGKVRNLIRRKFRLPYEVSSQEDYGGDAKKLARVQRE